MKHNQEQIYNWVFIDEGPFCDDVGDDGGMTTWGVTHSEVAKWRGKVKVTRKEMEGFTKDEAKLIYTAWYWTPLRCSDLPNGVDYTVFDTGLLHGVVRATMWLQVACNVVSDGKFGPKTLAAVANKTPQEIINGITELRRRRIKSHPDAKTFGKGWSNRITRVNERAAKLLKNNVK